MRYIFLLLPFMIAGCTLEDYHPKLAAPADTSKYAADREECIAATKRRSEIALAEYQASGRWLMAGLFGGAGGAVDNATGGEKDYNKSGYTMMDECLTKKGYKLAKN